MDHLSVEYHVFLDHDDASSLTHIERCRAALVAIEGRLAPRLKAAAWHREQFALWLWDPVIPESRRGCTAWAAGDASKSSAEPHLWGRVCVGESVDDEWFIVGLLLQLTAEQPDASVTVADEDGELLLIEAAHAIPRWLTPERATNRVFLRRGALHIVPRATRAKKVSSGGGAAAGSAAERDSLPLTDALDALRTQSLGITRHAAATELIRARTDPLLGADCTRRGPPSHGARCLLPPPVARMLQLEPSLAAAAAAAFSERDGAAMRLAARMPHCAPRTHGGTVDFFASLSRCTYAQLLAARFDAPAGVGFVTPPESHPSHKPAVLGARLAVGMELLLLYGSASSGGSAASAASTSSSSTSASSPSSSSAVTSSSYDDEAWHRFDAELAARGYFRGELPGSPLHVRMLDDAHSVLRQLPAAPPRASWLHAQADLARGLIESSRLSEVELPPPAELPAAESDAWLGIDEAELDEELERRAGKAQGGAAATPSPEASAASAASAGSKRPPAKLGKGSAAGKAGESITAEAVAEAEAKQLAEVVKSVGAFVDGKGSFEGAVLPTGPDEPVASLDVDRFLAALDGALGGGLLGEGGQGAGLGHRDEDLDDDDEEEEDGEEEDDEEDEEDGSDGEMDEAGTLGGLAEVMAAMDSELRGHQNGRSDFELEPEAEEEGEEEEASVGAAAAPTSRSAVPSPAATHAPSQSAGEDGAEAEGEADEVEDIRPVDLDLNLVKNLLASYSAQQGLAGPVSNLLGSMGLSLPDDQDGAAT